MNSLAMMAMNMIQNMPNVKDNPKAQECIDAIKNGDDAKGEQLAKEFCDFNKITPQEAGMKAKRFFGL